MFGRFAFLGIIALAIYVYSSGQHSTAATATVTQACSQAAPDAATVTVAWKPLASGAEQLWLDVGLSAGFAPGSYRAHGPLDVAQTAYALDGLPAGTKFYYRVNALAGGQWHAAASGSFVAACKH